MRVLARNLYRDELNKPTEFEPSQFGSSRDHIAAANAASKGPPTVFVWVWNKTGIKVFLNFWGLTLSFDF